MSIAFKLFLWKKNKTLLRITTVEKGVGHQVHLGNVIFADESGNNFLFYDLDQKKNYNFSMNEIEDIQPYEVKHKIPEKALPNPEAFKDGVQEEVISLIKKLPSDELYALVPLLQILTKKK